MFKIRTLAFMPLITLASSAFATGDHAAAPVMAQPSPAIQMDLVKQEEKRVAGVIKQFSNAYDKAEEPSIAVFWNRKFDDRLSQWEAIARRSVTGEASMSGSDVFKKRGDVERGDVISSTVDSLGSEPSGGLLGSYERGVSGGSRILAAEYSEVRAHDGSRQGLGEARDFEFSSGYLQPFIQNSVKILDRSAIMRLIERDNAKEAGSEMISDYQKVETDALVGYADYLAEIVFTPDSSTEVNMSFMVSVKEVATGRVVAMFKSTGTPPDLGAPKTKWVASGDGYVKQLVKDSDAIATPEKVGKQLALETMENLTKVWSKF